MANDLITWDRIIDLKNDKDLREAVKLLKEIVKVYKSLEKSSTQLKNKHANNLKAVIDQTKLLASETQKLSPATEQGKKSIVDISAKAELLAGTYDSLKGKVVSLEGSTRKLTKEKKAVAESVKKVVDLEKEEAKLLNKLNLLEKDNAKNIAATRVKIQEKNKELKIAARESLGLITIYQREAKQLVDLRSKYKSIALQYGVNSKEARKLEKQVAALDKRLKTVDQRAGQHQRSVGNYGKAWDRLGGSIRSVVTALGFTGVIFGLVAVFRNATRALFQFDEEMVNLAAISGKSREDLKGLENEIRRVAKTSINTAVDVAKTATALSTLGKTEVEIIDLLEPVNKLSIALKAQADQAGELLVKTLNAFGESAEAGERYANVIAKVRTSTALDFQRISDALGFLAPTANTVNLTIERTGAILGVLVDNSIKAARAGRLMNSSFSRLNKMGLTLDEALDMINNSQDRLATSTQLFGTEAFSLGIILADNVNKINEYDESFQKAGGTLDELTEKQLQALTNKVKILDSAWQELTLSVESGEGAIGSFISSMIEGLTDVITIITGAQNGTIGWGEALAALADPIQMNMMLLKIAAIEAGNAAKEQERLAHNQRIAQQLYNKAVADGIKTFDQFRAANKHFFDDYENNAPVLERINKLFGEDFEDAGKTNITTRKGIIKTLDEEIKALREKRDLATSDDEIEHINVQITLRENEKKRLDKLGDSYKNLKSKILPVKAELKGIPKQLDEIDRSSERMFSNFELGFIAVKNFFKNFSKEITNAFMNAFIALDNFLIAQEDRRIISLEKQLEALESSKERELDIVGNNEDARKAIEDRFQKQKEKVEANIRKERTKAARREKAVVLAQAIINGAAAVVQALPNLALSFLIGSLAAAQVGLIASTPVPEYFRGTPESGHPGGPAWVGERGREIIQEPGKKPYIQDRKAMVDLPKGTQVFNNTVTERVISKVLAGDPVAVNEKAAKDARDSMLSRQQHSLKRAFEPSIKKQTNVMADSIAETMSKIEIHQWHMGKRGLSKNIKRGTTTHLDVSQENSHGG